MKHLFSATAMVALMAATAPVSADSLSLSAVSTQGTTEAAGAGAGGAGTAAGAGVTAGVVAGGAALVVATALVVALDSTSSTGTTN